MEKTELWGSYCSPSYCDKIDAHVFLRQAFKPRRRCNSKDFHWRGFYATSKVRALQRDYEKPIKEHM